MENKGLILILVATVVILLIGLFSMILLNNPCELTITSPNTLQDGSKLTLKDKNQNPLSNKEIEKEATAKGWHYIPGRDDEGNDIGAYVPYDPVNGCYHT